MDINETWRITSQSENVILEEKHISDKEGSEGAEYWTTEGYYSNVANALKDMVDKEIKGTGMESLELVNDKINELYAIIDLLRIAPVKHHKPKLGEKKVKE